MLDCCIAADGTTNSWTGNIKSIKNKGVGISRLIFVRYANRPDVHSVRNTADSDKEFVDDPWCHLGEEVADIGLGMPILMVVCGVTIHKVNLHRRSVSLE